MKLQLLQDALQLNDAVCVRPCSWPHTLSRIVSTGYHLRHWMFEAWRLRVFIRINILIDREQTLNNRFCHGCLDFVIVFLKQAIHQIAGLKFRCNPFADLVCRAVRELVDVNVLYKFVCQPSQKLWFICTVFALFHCFLAHRSFSCKPRKNRTVATQQTRPLRPLLPWITFLYWWDLLKKCSSLLLLVVAVSQQTRSLRPLLPWIPCRY